MMEYDKYIKYIWAVIIGYIGYHVVGWLNRKYAQVFSSISDSAMILQAIYLLTGIVIACTVLILFSIKDLDNK